MKVNCPSCSAKYVIADHKVRGKQIKIRCRSCKNQIPVDGRNLDEQAAAEQAAADAAEEAATAEAASNEDAGVAADLWSVNLSDDDNREMTEAELIDAYRTGQIPDDAYVWKEGLDDWKPILEVAELAPHLTRAGVASSASGAGMPVQPALPQAPVGPTAARTRSEPSKDLFAMKDVVGPDDDPNQLMDMDKLTGQRNENSVLFSLDALKADFGAPAPPAAKAAPRDASDPFGMSEAPMASFGLPMDNQALLTAPAPKPKPKKVEATLESGSAPTRGNKNMLFIAGGIVAVLLVGGLALAVSGDDEEAQAAAAASAESARKQAEEAERKLKEAEEKAREAEEKVAEAEKKAKEAAKAKEEAAATAEKDDKKPEEDDKEKESSDDKASASKGSVATGAAKRATEKKTEPAAAAAGPFNTGAAKAALASAAAAAAACKIPGGPTGSGKAVVTFAPSGRVTSANVVGGSFGGTSVGGCVASKFRGARVPPFSGSSVRVSKSFSVR